MELNSFSFQPLSEVNSIRLLHLEPAESLDAPLHGRLVHTTVRERADDIYTGYIALSYVWGDPSKKGSIMIEGLQVIITASLDAALRGIRDTALACRIWADALCIDQGNIPERNVQVGLMGSIYESADHTVIFLGPLTPDAESVLQKAADPANIDEVAGNSEMIALAQRDILLRPWFRRTWVLQELVLSRDPWVQCGRVRSRWASLCALLLGTRAAERPSGKPLDPPEVSSLHTLIVMNAARSRRKGNDLFELLRARRSFEATDHRDFIYALLGLVEDSQWQLAGAVNYALPVQHAFFLAACSFLRCHPYKGLEQLLSDADAAVSPSGDSQPEGHPSWVPNWALPPACMTPLPNMFRISREKRPTEDDRTWEIVPEPPILLSLGLPLQVIAAVGPVFPPASSVNLTAGRWALSALERINPRRKGITGPATVPVVRRYIEAWINLFKDMPAEQGPQYAETSTDLSLFFKGFEKEVERSCTISELDPQFRLQMEDYLRQGMSREQSHEFGFWLGRSGEPKPVLEGRRFAITQEGALATVPAHTKPGDICVSFFWTMKQFVCSHVPADKSSEAQEERLARKEAAVLKAAQLKFEPEERYYHHGVGNRKPAKVPVVAYVRIVGQCIVGERHMEWEYVPRKDLKIYALE